MKKLPAVVLVLLLFAMIVPNAYADSYAPTFSCISKLSSDFQCPFGGTGGVTATDVSFPGPASIAVTVSGEGVSDVFNMSFAVGDSPTDTYQWLYTDGGDTVGGYSYASLELTDEATNLSDSVTLYAQNLPVTGGDEEAGPLTFSLVTAAAPEATSALLMLFGLGLVFLTCKRFICGPVARFF